MRDYIIIIPISIVFLLIKSSIFSWMPLPDLLLIITFHLAITRPTALGVFLIFTIGYFSDAFNGAIMGATSFGLIVIYLITYMFSHKLHLKGANWQTITLGAFSLVKGLLVFYIISGATEVELLYKVIVPTALMTGLLAPFLLTMLQILDNKFDLNKFKGSLQ